MASFTQTRDLERSLIKLLTGSQMLARLHMNKVKAAWFTSPERTFIVSSMMEVMSNSKAVLTRQVFEYMVGAKVPDSEKSSYISEWNFIEALTTNENMDVLVSKLDEARVGQEVLGMAEEVAELLEQGRVADALSALKMKAVTISGDVETRPIVEITDYERRLQLIRDKQAHPEKYKGYRTGFDTFDRATGGIYKNELLLLAGITGLGKSTLVKQLCSNLVLFNKGLNVLHIANEEHQEQVESKYDANLSGVHYANFKSAEITEEEIDKWTGKMKRMKEKAEEGSYGRIFTREVAAFTDATLIEQTYRELENQGIKIDVIVIDHLPHLKPIQQAWGENDERAKAASDCKELARSLHVAVVVPTQAATEVEEKQNKGRRAGKLDVYGSKGQIHVANTFIIITSKGPDGSQVLGKDIKEDWERDVFWMADCKKNRDGAPFWFYAKHFVKNGRVVEVHEDDMNKAQSQTAEDKKEEDEAIDDVIGEVEKEYKKEAKSVGDGAGEVDRSIDDALEESDESVDGPKTAQDEPQGDGEAQVNTDTSKDDKGDSGAPEASEKPIEGESRVARMMRLRREREKS